MHFLLPGYFMDSSNIKWNPGAGAQCEGEDWTSINSISSIDVTTVHVYDRQMEDVPPTWRHPTFEDLLNWCVTVALMGLCDCISPSS